MTCQSESKPSSCGARIFGTLFGLVFAGMGGVFVVLILSSAWRALLTRTWEAAPCTVLQCRIDRDGDEFVPVVRYRYTIEGRPHTSDRYGFNKVRLGGVAEADRLARRLAAGTETTCYVNPRNPAEAVLVRGNPLTGLVALFPMIFVAVGVGVIYISWRGERPVHRRSISSQARSGSSKWGVAIPVGLLLLFPIVGLLAGYLIFVNPLLKVRASRGWVETPCTVVESKVRSHEGDDGTTYSVYVLYAYTFDEVDYRSDRYSFFGGSSSGRRAKAAVVARYLPGRKAVCYVNPEDPYEAVLDRTCTQSLWIALFPLAFVAAGVGGIVLVLKKGREKGQKSAVPVNEFENSPALSAEATTGAGLEPVPCTTGPVTLKPKSSRVGKLIGITVAALFWNGIVSVFLYQMIEGWRHGRGDWFLTLFLVPFVAVGLGLLVGIVYYAMALRNPRIELITDSTRVRLGQQVGLKWSVYGRAERLSSLTIMLEGVESATYRRGTDTTTVTETFAEILIAKETSADRIAVGGAIFTVPGDTMHSFDAPNNKILWRIKVVGDIPRWPDLKDEYEITVLPHPVEEGAVQWSS